MPLVSLYAPYPRPRTEGGNQFVVTGTKGTSLRRARKPMVVRTVLTQRVRSLFGYIVEYWKNTLDNDQRNYWYVLNDIGWYTVYDDYINIYGATQFIACQLPLMEAGIISVPVGTPNIGFDGYQYDLDLGSAYISSGIINFRIISTRDLITNGHVIAWITAPGRLGALPRWQNAKMAGYQDLDEFGTDIGSGFYAYDI